MSEGLQLIIWICKFLLVGVCAVLYRIGGWMNKAFRRFLMPVVYISGCALISLWKGNYSNWLWLSLPILIGTLCMGYSNNQGQGLRKRFIMGLLLCLTFLNFAFISGKWVLYEWHCVLSVASMVIFGILNPFNSAVEEETMIATMSLIMPVMMI